MTYHFRREGRSERSGEEEDKGGSSSGCLHSVHKGLSITVRFHLNNNGLLSKVLLILKSRQTELNHMVPSRAADHDQLDGNSL